MRKILVTLAAFVPRDSELGLRMMRIRGWSAPALWSGGWPARTGR